MRIGIADDAMLIREGVAQLLSGAGFEIAFKVGDAEGLLRLVEARAPQAVILDIKMPPTHTEEGLVAADAIRAAHPEVGVLLLSQYLAPEYALRLLERHPSGVGYLLKERVSDIAVLADALRRVAEQESVLDPTIVARLSPAPRRGAARRADRPRARRAGADGRGPLEPRHLLEAVPQHEDRGGPCRAHLRQARAQRLAGSAPSRGGGARLPRR